MQRLCLVVSRSLQTSAAALQAPTGASAVSGVEPGAKAVLYGILKDTPTPLNSEQIWQQAEEAGLKSKRHTKLMLQAMRKAGAVQTKPMGKGQNYVYALRSSPKKHEASNAAQGIKTNFASA
ncbi:hypothetical protein WJX77_003495 [Trebouxia sp. C0004]